MPAGMRRPKATNAIGRLWFNVVLARQGWPAPHEGASSVQIGDGKLMPNISLRGVAVSDISKLDLQGRTVLVTGGVGCWAVN
jgi:hypothetical protein